MAIMKISTSDIKQFISYFGVGGAAALVEWGSFFVFDSLLHKSYLLATVLAFFIATMVNWFLGRTFTFKESSYKDKKGKEIVLVFAVSAIGLLFNMVLMYLFVSVLNLKTSFLRTIAKVISSGIVFVWNYIARKRYIYRNKV